MTSRGLLPLLFVFVGLLGGCAELSMRLGVGDLDDHLDRLVAAQEYGRALDLIDAVPERDPEYQHYRYRREHILDLAARYEVETFAEAAQAQVDGDWEAALARYQEGLDKYPDSILLQDGLRYLRDAQAKRTDEISQELLINRGQYLVEALPRQRKLTEVDPENRGARRLREQLEREALEVGAALGERGGRALERGDVDLAERTLPLAAKLNPSPEIEARYQGLKALERAARTQERTEQKKVQVDKQRERVQARKLRSRELYAIYERAEQNQDLVRARDALSEIIRIEGKSSRAVALLDDLEARIDVRVEDLNAQGGTSYSRGQFEDAVVFWKRALELDPDNEEVQSNLRRAQRVLAKLKELREKQKVEVGGE
jgi:tetratricopeptide (TPR) repeat protein